MVSAVKVNNKQGLESFIKRFSKETKKQYVYDNTVISGSDFVDKSVQKLAVNSIIEGYFPKENLVKHMAIKKVNKMLCFLLSLLIGVVIISYYFVLSCEIKLNDISRQTVILNNENEELQNRLDSLKSFNNVDKTLQKNNMLQSSGKVIETNEVIIDETPLSPLKKHNRKIFKYAIGF